MAARDPVRRAINSELVFTVALLGASVFIFIRTFTIKLTPTADEFGPRTLPQVISVLLILWSLFQIVRLLRLRTRDWSRVDTVLQEAEGDIEVEDLLPEVVDASGAQMEEVLALAVEEIEQEVVLRPAFKWLPHPPTKANKRLLLSVSMIAYVLVMQFVGFLIATLLFVAIGLWLFVEESPRVMIALPLVLSIGLYVLFEYALHVRLP